MKARFGWLHVEEIGRDGRTNRHDFFDLKHLRHQKGRDGFTTNNDFPEVDFVERFRQNIIYRPKMSAAKHPTRMLAYNVDREKLCLTIWKIDRHLQEQLTVRPIHIHF